MFDPSHRILDPTIHNIKDWRSTNKQFSVDSYLDWEGRHWVCISLSSDHRIRLANENHLLCGVLEVISMIIGKAGI